jgi:hypothetical protein
MQKPIAPATAGHIINLADRKQYPLETAHMNTIALSATSATPNIPGIDLRYGIFHSGMLNVIIAIDYNPIYQCTVNCSNNEKEFETADTKVGSQTRRPGKQNPRFFGSNCINLTPEVLFDLHLK